MRAVQMIDLNDTRAYIEVNRAPHASGGGHLGGPALRTPGGLLFTGSARGPV
jgi:hypothetical protein